MTKQDKFDRIAAARAAGEALRNKHRVNNVIDTSNMIDVDELHDKLDGMVEKAVMDVTSAIRADIRADVDEILGSARETVLKIVQPNQVTSKIDGLTHFQLPLLIKSASVRDQWGNRKNVLLKGNMGGGKSTACKQVADALGLSFGYIGQTNMPHIVVGSRDPLDKQYFRHTAFTEAFINGGVIVFEELDAWHPNASLVLNAPLANGWLTLEDGSKHMRHKDCIIIGCANTWGTGATAEYVGRNKLDDAFLDRFGIKIDWLYDNALERAAAADEIVVDAVQKARYNANVMGLKVAISPRSSIDVADMVRCGFDMREAMELNFLAGLDRDTCTKLLDGVDF